MIFLNREAESARLDRLARGRWGGFAVVYGRRRIGKTRLLLEWATKHNGLYTVADQSSSHVQRQYFARAAADFLEGFADVEYPDWRSLLVRLAQEAKHLKWRGPIIFDEFPYLVLSSPELPSVLQHWVDYEAKDARLVVAVSGSSQRMMQGLVLSDDAPLYGRAHEILKLEPLEPGFLQPALHPQGPIELVEHYTAWGGVPRYWELARSLRGSPRSRIDQLVLDPLGPLHREPDRLLLEEVPSALEVRPVLDAIGAGAHKVSEIAGRIGFSATSMSRPLDRLIGLGLVRRDVPFGEAEKKSRRSLYKIDDPFFRLWFRVVAPHRAQLAAGARRSRVQLLGRYWNALAASAWEDLCRRRIPKASSSTDLGKRGPWEPASRWWKGATLGWDLLSESVDGKRLLLGEVKWSRRSFGHSELERAVRALAAKPLPDLPKRFSERKSVRALFVPEVRSDYRSADFAVLVVTASDLIR